MQGMNQILPNATTEDLPNGDEIFHVLYSLDEKFQIPGYQYIGTGRTYEKDGFDPKWRAIRDEHGRILVAICHNMHMGDAWEHADDPQYHGTFFFPGLPFWAHQLHRVCDDSLISRGNSELPQGMRVLDARESAGPASLNSERTMRRRDFVKLGCAAAAGLGAGKLALPQTAQSMPPMLGMPSAPQDAAPAGKADYTLEIAPQIVEIAPTIAISTVAYNGKVPGPLMRVREGQPVTVDVVNNTDTPEFVHWHGMYVASEIDGAEEGHADGAAARTPAEFQLWRGRQACVGITHAIMMDLHRGAPCGTVRFSRGVRE